MPVTPLYVFQIKNIQKKNTNLHYITIFHYINDSIEYQLN